MRNCNNCLENNWDFQYIDGTIIATCLECGNEVEFEAGHNKIEISQGEQCRKCGGIIELKESKFKSSKLKKAFYYTDYYRCAQCKTFYMSDKFKIINNK